MNSGNLNKTIDRYVIITDTHAITHLHIPAHTHTHVSTGFQLKLLHCTERIYANCNRCSNKNCSTQKLCYNTTLDMSASKQHNIFHV